MPFCAPSKRLQLISRQSTPWSYTWLVTNLNHSISFQYRLSYGRWIALPSILLANICNHTGFCPDRFLFPICGLRYTQLSTSLQGVHIIFNLDFKPTPTYYFNKSHIQVPPWNIMQCITITWGKHIINRPKNCSGITINTIIILYQKFSNKVLMIYSR